MKDQARLGAALRENLKRRKMQARALGQSTAAIPDLGTTADGIGAATTNHGGAATANHVVPAKAGTHPESADGTAEPRFRGNDGVRGGAKE